MTTIPQRVKNLNKSVESLLKQSKKPDKIFVNIGIRDELHSMREFDFLSMIDKNDSEDKELLISSMTLFMVIIYILIASEYSFFRSSGISLSFQSPAFLSRSKILPVS